MDCSFSLVFCLVPLKEVLCVHSTYKGDLEVSLVKISSLNVCHGQVDVPIQQSYLWYGSSSGPDGQVHNFYPPIRM
jgi:hypothetical protein